MTESTEHSEAIRRQRAVAIVAYLGHYRDRILPAISLAAVCCIEGCRENQKRRVREAVTFARDVLTERICGNGEGYWLAEDLAEWHRYQAHLTGRSKGTFARIRNRREAATDRISGQGKLFETRPMAY